MNNINLYLGDSKEILKSIEDNSVDCIVSDPPYGYSFMGKNWDKVVIPSSHWKECLRVLKPGAFAFIMSASRQDVLSRMIINLQDAGFETGFSSIYWSYATGFPKASNMGKMVDKRLGKKRKKIGKGKSGKPETHKSSYQMANQEYKNAFDGDYDITKGSSELEGSYAGFQPKPAVEIIIVAMKPLDEKSYIDQAMKNGKGITWLDNCKIPYKSGKPESGWSKTGADGTKGYQNTDTFKIRKMSAKEIQKNVKDGRFPANLLVSNDSLNDGKISKSPSGKCKRKPRKGQVFTDKTSGFKSENLTETGKGDKGSYSRYFDLDAWWRERIKKLPKSVQKVFPFLITPKPSKKEKNKGCENLETKKMTYEDTSRTNKETVDKFGCERKSKMKNIHPTCKPIKLMSYLITLGSREGDVILDPFAGSCTTGIACKLLNRKFIGIEMNKEYLDIGMARIKGWSKNDKEKK